MTARPRPSGWDRILGRLLPGWFLTMWGPEVRELLRAEESAARSRGRGALMRFRLSAGVDLVRAAWQTRHHGSAGLGGDVRLALRLFRRSPVFTSVTVLSLAIGIALSATAFSVLDPAFFRPLPFPDADRLFSIRVATFQGAEQRARSVTYAQYQAWQTARAGGSADVLAATLRRFYQTGAQGGVEDPFNDILVQTVSPEFLSVVGARTQIGRVLTAEDFRADSPPVALISDEYWRRKHGSRQEIVGSHITISGSPYTVLGVLAPGHHFAAQPADVIRPLVAGTAIEPSPGSIVDVIARLREGATADRLSAELSGILNSGRKPDTGRPAEALLEPIRFRLYGWARNTFLPFAGVAGLLLLLVTANVANLALVRASARRQEMALRAALGAARARLARLVLVEAGLLTFASCALGLVLSSWTIALLVRLNPLGVGGTHPVFDLRAGIVGSVVALVAATLSLVWPGLTVARRDRAGSLRQGPHSTDSPQQRFSQRSLVMCQIACALVVLIGAGLLAKTILRMEAYDPGIDARRLLTAEVDVPREVSDRLVDELRTIPGVTSSAVGTGTSLSAQNPLTVRSEAGVRPAPVASTDRLAYVSAGYFETLGIPVVQGRMLTPHEFAGRLPLAVVNEEAARRWWGGATDVIGSEVRVGPPGSTSPWVTVVGVVRNTSPLSVWSVADAPAARLFLPFASAGTSVTLYARTSGEALAVLPVLHTRVLALDRRIRVLMPLEARERMEWEISRQRMTANFVGALAIFALVLASMGIYGVTSYAVGRRLRELGIRRALGAGASHLVAAVGRETAWLAIGGIAIGLAASAAATRVLEAMLYGTSPLDAWVFAGASLGIIAVVVLAAWRPIRSALRVDPIATLRSE